MPNEPKTYTSNPSRDERFLADLKHRIEWHRNNQNDPHDYSRFALAALSEVHDAYAKSRNLPLLPK
ncbi:MAG: hypothetical protein JSR30_00190 [Proteobacteria bacterium]|nr:hypothetical protein [Pseudomonadota bacterium]